MRIRKPIAFPFRVLLGLASILALAGGYSWFAQTRATVKRAEARGKWEAIQEELAALDATEAETNAGSEQTRQRLTERAATLEVDMQEAVDRSVPTWSSLYRDGWLRVTTPQGLRKDEYWLWEDCLASGGRLLAGLSLGVALSVLIGVLMGSFTEIEAIFVPPLSFLAKVPPTAMLAAFFVLVGTSLKMYITMIAFGTLPTLAQTVYQSAKKDVADALIYKASTLGASTAEIIWNVIFRQILPRIIDAVRLQVGPALVLLIAAEWMVSGEGFGYRLRLFYQRTDMTVVYLYTFLLGAAGLAVDYLLIGIRRWLCPWFGE